MTTPFYQIGWSESHHRDIRLEIEGSLSAPVIRLARYQANGEVTYIKLLMGETVRLYDALGQVITNQRPTGKVYKEPCHDSWGCSTEDGEDDPVCSD